MKPPSPAGNASGKSTSSMTSEIARNGVQAALLGHSRGYRRPDDRDQRVAGVCLKSPGNRPETAGNGPERRRQGPEGEAGRLVSISTPYWEGRPSTDIFSFRREPGRLGMIPKVMSHNYDYVNLREKSNSTFHAFMKTGCYDRMKGLGYNAAGRMMS